MSTDNLTQGQDPERLRVLLLLDELRRLRVRNCDIARAAGVTPSRISRVLRNPACTAPFIRVLREAGVREHLLPVEVPARGTTGEAS